MAKVTVYNHTFDVPDRYAEGHTLVANEATALNNLMAEMISHKIRSGPLDALSRGETPNDEQIAAANALIAEQAQSYQFGAGRVGGAGRVVRSPLEAECITIARKEVRAALAKKNLKLAKKGESARDGEYPFDAFEAKVEEVAKMDKVVAQAKKVLRAREGGESVDVDI